MAKRIELPQTPQGSEEEQLRAMYSYLYQMAMTLNSNLAEIGGSELTDAEMRIMREVLDGPEAEGPAGYNWREAETLKSMIIKTAQFVRTAIDEYNMKLIGTVEAEGTIGKYMQKTTMDVIVNPEGATQKFTFREIIQGLKEFEIFSKNYIKSGLLRIEHALPVYGIAVGKDIVTFSEDGTETYNDGNKVAEFTADELSFWQNQAKIASYTGNKISFLYRGDDVFYIQNGKIYTSGDMQIGAGKKLEIVGNAGIHIQTNGKLQIDSGQLQIDGNGNATFSGTLAAAVVQALVLTGNQIQGGTLTLGGANNGNGRMVIQNANGQQIGYWDNTGLHVNEGEITGNAIKGGTLTLGGANNTGGRLVIKNAQGQQIGYWDNTGLHVDEGVISGGAISGGTIDASDVTIINLDADNITSGSMSANRITTGTMSANRISGGQIDATDVSIINLNASNINSGAINADLITTGSMSANRITTGTMSANRISGGSIDARNVTITNLNASNINSGAINADLITTGSMSAQRITSGTMSANRISGGKLTLGGANNGNGEIEVKDAGGATIGSWTKDGLSATKGTFNGDLSIVEGTAGTGSYSNWHLDNKGLWTTKYDSATGSYYEFGMGTNMYMQQLVSGRYPLCFIGMMRSYIIFQLRDSTSRSATGSIKFATSHDGSTYNNVIYSEERLSVGTSYSRCYNVYSQNIGSSNYPTDMLYIKDGTYSGSWTQSSSRAVKHGIRKLESAGEKIDALEPVRYIYNDDPEEKEHNGLIYEDTVRVMPEICNGKTEDKEKGIDYIGLIPVLLKEIQELRARVKALEERG